MPIEQKAYDSTIMGGVPYYDDFDQDKKFLKMLLRVMRDGEVDSKISMAIQC